MERLHILLQAPYIAFIWLNPAHLQPATYPAQVLRECQYRDVMTIAAKQLGFLSRCAGH